MSTENARRTVLVVDDEPQVLAAIADTLEDEYHVVVQTSPQAALRAMQDEPDLSVILSDQRMPGMSGDEFLARAGAISDASRVMISGYADLEGVVRAVNNGHIFGYISKPWDPRGLKLAIYKAAEHHRLLRELSEEQRLLHNLMDNIPDAIFFKDVEHRFLRINRVHAAILGVERPEDAVGRPTSDFFPPDEARERDAEDREVMLTGTPLPDKVRRITLPGGGFRWRSTTKAPIKDEKGQITGLVGVARDITERQIVEQKVRRLNRVYAVLSGINALIVRVRDRDELYREACRIAVEAGGFRFAWVGLVDREAMQLAPAAWAGVEQDFFAAVRTRLSLSESDAQGRSMVARVVLAREAMFSNDVADDPRILFKQEFAERGIRSLAVFPLIVSGEVACILALHAAELGLFDEEELRLLTELAGDISFALEHIEKTERLDYLAYYDSLTGLANRSLFVERVTESLHSTRQTPWRVALIVANIERFRTINDSLGRQAGDLLLKQAAERLRSNVPVPTHVARLVGDHFAILLPEAKAESDVARWLEQLTRKWLGEPFRIGDTELHISANAGIALSAVDSGDADTLFKQAEAALENAKRTGEPYLFYEQAMTDRVAGTLTLENQLRRALEREEFVLHYQPKVDLASRRIVGMEALIRWKPPEGGLVPPMKFIPLLEETGLILPVGAWAMRKAAQDHRELLRQGIAAPRVAVNVSAIQLRRRDFVETLKRALEDGASPPAIDLEITESLVMEGIAENIQKLSAVRELGLQIAIDDFGTGYSSLAYLAKLPVHALKIDRSFIITMLDDPNATTLVSTIISLARSLKLKVVAEGVDSEDQANVLRLLRCDEMQGYLFSKPLPLAEVAALLNREKR
jgi:diguanylate cyclase (GGDEF)-like protein/PAS domain S-box-containing protein